MTVTRQQQLEYAAKHIEKWKSGYDFAVVEKTTDGHLCVRWPSICTSGITKKEWQQERDKMYKQSTQDNSWHERGELPPCGVPVELWFGGSFAYNCEFIVMRGNTYVLWNLDADRPDAADYMNSEFRPLRTEREKAIEEMIGILKAKFDRSGIDGIAVADIVDELYAAGYRKVNP